jgi:hypothetical protein
MIGGYKPENASCLPDYTGVFTSFKDAVIENPENPDDRRWVVQRGIYINGKAYRVRSVLAPTADVTPTDKLKALIDAEIKSRMA